MHFADLSTVAVADLATFARDSYVHTFGHLYAQTDLDTFLDRAYDPDGLAKEAAQPGYAYRIAHDAQGIAGYIKIGPLGLPVDPDLVAGRRVFELKQLYLRPDHFGSGLAQQLMRWAWSAYAQRGVERLFLSVYSDNPRAQRFYARYGFKRCGRYHFMVGNHADEEYLYMADFDPQAAG